jgi:hypothetical protein
VVKEQTAAVARPAQLVDYQRVESVEREREMINT